MKTKLITGIIFLMTLTLHAQQNWDTDGNSVSSGDFLGTTNSKPLIFKTNGNEVARFTTAGLLGIGTSSPLFKVHLLNGLDNGSPLDFGNCNEESMPDSAISFFSISSRIGNNVGVVGIGKKNNSTNVGGYFRGEGNWTSGDCAFNIGTNTSALGNGISTDEADWITNIGVISDAFGENAINIGGNFTATNDDCYGNSIGIYAEASGGSSIVAIYGEALNDNMCLTDSTTVAGGGKVPTIFAGYFNGNTFTAGNAYLASDAKLKKNITEIENASELLSKINARSYSFNTSEFSTLSLPGGRHYGVIAQEVEKVLPEMILNTTTVAPDRNGTKRETYDIKTVNYTEFIPLLIAAHKEQRETIEKLETSLAGYEKETEAMRKELNEVKLLIKQICQYGCDKTRIESVRDDEDFLNCYPNPSTQIVNIGYAVKSSSNNIEIELRDMNGKIHQTISANQPKGDVSINVSSLAAGSYIIILKTENGIVKSQTIAVGK